MAKISKIKNLKMANIMKQRKFEQIKLLKEKEASIQLEKQLQCDMFIKSTAKAMVKDFFKCELQVFDAKTSIKNL